MTGAALARDLLKLRGRAPTDAALDAIGLCLFDWAVCGIMGAAEPVAAAARSLAAGGPVTLFGGGTADPRTAALINGATSHALDYDDTHFAHIGHTTVAVLPAVLAVQEARDLPPRAALQAAAVGAETAVRFGLWLGRGHYEAGFHQTATAGAFGATMAAAVLLGLDDDRTLHALGLCATRAAGLKSQFGTMGKPLNAGFAAATGVECALLAEAGATSTLAALDGPQGFAATHAGLAEDRAWDLTNADDWRIRDISFKFHACCHGLHAMLEALGSLGPLDGIEAVEVFTHPRWLSVCNQPAPETGLAAKFSYRLTAAMALAGVSTAALASFSSATCARPDLVALRDRVTVTPDADLPETAARVRVRLADGVREASHDLSDPLPPAVLAAKLRGKAEALLGMERAGALWEATRPGGPLDTDSLRGLMRSAAPS